MDADTILRHIEASNVTGNEYRTARRLLDRVSNHWTVLISREEACAVCGVTTWAAARRALNKLEEAGLIGLHTNNLAYVDFIEPIQNGAGRAETDHQRAEMAREEPEYLTEPRHNGAQRAERPGSLEA